MDFAFTRKIHQRGVSPKEHLTVAFPKASRLTDWNGKQIETPSLVCFGIGREFDCISDADFAGQTLSIDAAHAILIGERLDLPLPETDFEAFISPKLSDRRKAASVAVTVDRLMAHGRDVTAADEDSLIEDLLHLACGASPVPEWRPSTKSKRALSIAIEMMTENADENIPIHAICHEAGVSLRSLERTFKDRFGIGPKEYYTRLRLGRARSLMIEAGPEIRVSDAANRYGFWHIGQFSMDYRQRFGERPSETIGRTGYTS